MFDFCYFTNHKFTLVILRYVATVVTSVHEMENGFNIWSFNGKHLYRRLKDNFFHVITISFVLDTLFVLVCVLQLFKELISDVQCLNGYIFGHGNFPLVNLGLTV